MNVFIVGCGYVGQEVAVRMINAGYTVSGSTRRPESAFHLRTLGVDSVANDWLNDARPAQLESADVIVVAVTHAAVEGVDATQTHVRGLQRLFSEPLPRLRRFIYLSTTGVMASNAHSEWVDEASSIGPLRPGSIAASHAELWLRDSCPQRDYVILRLAGIYGRDRVPNLESLRQQRPLAIAPESYLNLIHVADIAQVVHQACTARLNRHLYLVSDGNAVKRRNYYDWICQFTGLPQPRYAETCEDAGRGTGNKRVSNRRLTEDMDIDFAFPSFREGLAKLLPSKRG